MQVETALESRASWPAWAEILRRHRLENHVAWALEAAGPWTLIGAQALHIGEPFLRQTISENNFHALVRLLENINERYAFITYLRGEEKI